MEIECIRSYQEYMKYLQETEKRMQKRVALERYLSEQGGQALEQSKRRLFKAKSKRTYTYIGFCEVCDLPTTFHMDFLYSIGPIINFREHLTCDHCYLCSRQRFMLSYLKQQIERQRQINYNPTIFLYEQITTFYEKAKEVLKANIIGSEYCGADKPPGEMINGIMHQDAQNLSFQNTSFDYLVSNDVFEHVFDIDATLREAHRVLKPQGRLVFTVPFYSMNEKTVKRVEMEDNNITYHYPPIYHGNPMSEEGSLVVNDFGWDIFDRIKVAGFSDSYLMCYYSYEYGYMGHGLQMAICAEK